MSLTEDRNKLPGLREKKGTGGEIKDVPGHCEEDLLSHIQRHKEHGTKIALLCC